MRTTYIRCIALSLACIALVLPTACHTSNPSVFAFAEAINAYYASRPACIWPQPVHFPVTIDAANTAETARFDALADQGVIIRDTREPRDESASAAHPSVYQLNERGHSFVAPDPADPNTGNLCYGHRNVVMIDNSTGAPPAPGARTEIDYRYQIVAAPEWALSQTVQAAFPDMRTRIISASAAHATLERTASGTWRMLPPQ